MANTRNKSNGCRRGKFKRKKMGKGWLAHRRVPIPEIPKNKRAEEEAAAAQKAAETADA